MKYKGNLGGITPLLESIEKIGEHYSVRIIHEVDRANMKLKGENFLSKLYEMGFESSDKCIIEGPVKLIGENK